MPTIAVDAMGGLSGPDEVVKGVAQASVETDIQMVLVGDEHRIQPLLERIAYNPEHISLHHAPETLDAGDDPRRAGGRQARRASIYAAAALVAGGEADAVVTAGSTTAALLACERHFRLLRGVRTPALAAVYPQQTGAPGEDPLALLLDVGATTRCEAADLVQFAAMGHAYARAIARRPAPRVALLNMGADPAAGGEVLARAHRLLAATAGIRFVGNIQGNDLTRGLADVIVCEGLLGHVVLRLLEGLADMIVDLAGTAAREHWRWRLGLLMLASGFGKLRDLTEYPAYGGAPVLGYEHLLIAAHPRSGARAIKNAVKVAAKAVRDGVVRDIAAALRPA